MKTKILILITFISSLLMLVNAQSPILPVNTPYGQAPDGAYLKDIGNVMNKFIGTWQGNWGNKVFKIELIKTMEQLDVVQKTIYEDIIKGKYYVFNSSGTLLYDSNDEYALESIGIDGDTQLSILMRDVDRCGIAGTGGHMRVMYPEYTTMTIKVHLYAGIIGGNNCESYRTTETFTIPTEITLTKQ